ncbi:MAG TPA: hypothetical protein PLP17_07690, partial [Oligoflexia bacterium]|nr:hypothetical protein [Oligoflexia bacterium]
AGFFVNTLDRMLIDLPVLVDVKSPVPALFEHISKQLAGEGSILNQRSVPIPNDISYCRQWTPSNSVIELKS